MRLLAGVAVVLSVACGSRGGAELARASEGGEVVEPEGGSEEPAVGEVGRGTGVEGAGGEVAEGAVAGVEGGAAEADAGAPLAGCAVVQLGLDLRALGARTHTSAVDMFVFGQAHQLRELAGDPPLRVSHMPGAGILWGAFDDADDATALARCERTVARYLVDAPRLPVNMEPAASVIDPCARCPAPAE